jgi:hypothetical protein
MGTGCTFPRSDLLTTDVQIREMLRSSQPPESLSPTISALSDELARYDTRSYDFALSLNPRTAAYRDQSGVFPQKLWSRSLPIHVLHNVFKFGGLASRRSPILLRHIFSLCFEFAGDGAMLQQTPPPCGIESTSLAASPLKR